MTKNLDRSGKELIKKEYEKRKDTEKKAHNVVLQLLNSDISEEFFSTSLRFLTPQHYKDVVDERSISGLCGYCLCQNKVVSVPQQQYKIVKNRVFDITERKKFCSGACFAKSQHIVPQISSTPLWTRDHAVLPHVQIPNALVRGDVDGVEVQLGHVVLPTDDVNNLDGKDDGKEPIQCSADEQHLQSPIKVVVAQRGMETHTDTVGSERHKIARTNYMAFGAHGDLMSPILLILEQWFTRKSLEYLGINMIYDAKTVEVAEVTEDAPKHENLFQPEQKNEKHTQGAKCPIPDYKELCAQQQDYEKKVKNFMGNIEEKAGTSKPKYDHKVAEDITISLPTVDSRHQLRIRQKILKDHIVKIANGISVDAKLIRECLHLIDTFSLTSKNVMLPAEMWTPITISILLLISQKNRELNDILMSKKTFILAILRPYGLDIDKLEKNLPALLKRL